MKLPVILSLALFVALAPNAARTARAADAKELFEARVYESGEGKKLNYRLLTPASYDKQQKYPLVLFMHGAGERGDDNAVQLVHGMNDFARDENRTKFPCFVVAPQCPRNDSWRARRSADSPNPGPSETMQLVVALLDSLAKEFSVDARRLYVTGLSMGGMGTWDLIQRMPEKFAAAAPICGGGDPQQASKLVYLPIWVFHGDKDTSVPVDQSRQMVTAIRNAGGKPIYTEYVGVGHNSWEATYKDPMFMSWLFAQKRPE
jgi:predicted peptidase